MAEQYFKIRQSFHLTKRLAQLVSAQEEKMAGSALQLLLILINEMTETNSPNIMIPLGRFTSLRGLKDEKFARKQLTHDISQLVAARLCMVNRGIQNSVLHIELSTELIALLPEGQFIWLPLDVLRTSKNENMAARLLLEWRILQHKRMNLDRKNADVISVLSLLESCPAIPTLEQIGKSGQLGKRIVDPFEKALDNCTAFSWQYAGGSPNSYAEFLQSRIHIVWRDDPYAEFAALKSSKARRRVGGRNRGSSR